MNTNDAVIAVLGEVLGTNAVRGPLTTDTPLLGALPEFDSMAVISVLTAIEEHFGIAIDDDEVDASLFETVGTLCAFVEAKTGA